MTCQKITSLKWVLGEEQHFDDVATVGTTDVRSLKGTDE